MKMQSKMLAMSLFPLIVLGITTIIFGNVRIKEVVTDNIENGLRSSAVAVRDTISYADEGEYHVEDGTLYKGEFNVSEAVAIADHVKSASDMDITVFYGDIRYMTSVMDESGKRAVGTTVQDIVSEKVLKGNQEYFSDDANVNGKPYFGYYVPVTENGSTVGMVFAGMPQAEAKAEIDKIIGLIAGIMGVFVLVFSASTIFVVQRMAKGLKQGTAALEEVASGKLNGKMDDKIIKRKDEIGQISGAVVKLKDELNRVMSGIMDDSKALHDNSEALHEKTSTSAEHVTQIERAVEEIAEGAGNQAQETQSATENIITMGNMIEDTSREVDTLNENAKQIKISGQNAVQTLEELQKIMDTYPQMNICVALATSFGCPFEGIPPIQKVVDFTKRVYDMGIRSICLADTIGIADPRQVRDTIHAVTEVMPDCEFQIHIHDTRGMGQAKAVVFFVLVAIISIAQLVATRKKEVDQ